MVLTPTDYWRNVPFDESPAASGLARRISGVSWSRFGDCVDCPRSRPGSWWWTGSVGALGGLGGFEGDAGGVGVVFEAELVACGGDDVLDGEAEFGL
jgi:hypothetical protein